MPIANCFIRDRELVTGNLDRLVTDWAQIIGVDASDICINILPDSIQLGQSYSILVNLYLPSLWSEDDTKKIQMGLLEVLVRNLKVSQDSIFIMTSVIESGHVVENGKITKW